MKTRKVRLPGDKEELEDEDDGDLECKIRFNLHKILAHIEDLINIIRRVRGEQCQEMYLIPSLSKTDQLK